MATFPYDPMTMKALMESMPDIQRKKRRAEELRKQNQQFREMGAKQAKGTMLPTQHGGLYQTVAQYQPDYAGMANQGMGAIGDWMTGKQAEEAQGGYDQAQTEAILRSVQQMSQPQTPQTPAPPPGLPEGLQPGQSQMPMGMPQAPQLGNQPMSDSGAGAGLDAAADEAAGAFGNATPTAETLRAYLGMIAPELKDFLPRDQSDIKARDTEIDEEGNVWVGDSAGNWKKAGFKARAGMKPMMDPKTGRVFYVPTTTQGDASEVILGQGAGGQQGMAGVGEAPAGAIPVLDRQVLHERQKQQESGGNPNAVSSAGARGYMQLMPETARTLEARFGYPAGASDADPALNEQLGFLHMDELLEKYKGNQVDALMAYNRGEPAHDAWVKGDPSKGIPPRDPSRLPAETHGYLKKILGADPYAAQGAADTTGASVSATGNVPGDNQPGQPLRFGGARDIAEEKAMGDANAKAKEALGKAEASAEAGTRAISNLLKNETGLRAIVGKPGTMLDWGGVPDVLAQYAIPLFKSGEPEAAAMAGWQTVKSNAFLQAFEELRGGGQITEAEGTKAEQAKATLSRSQNYEEVRQALMDLQSVIDAGLRRARARAKGDFSGDNALNVTMPPMYTGPMATAPRAAAPAPAMDPELEEALRLYGGD